MEDGGRRRKKQDGRWQLMYVESRMEGRGGAGRGERATEKAGGEQKEEDK